MTDQNSFNFVIVKTMLNALCIKRECTFGFVVHHSEHEVKIKGVQIAITGSANHSQK